MGNIPNHKLKKEDPTYREALDLCEEIEIMVGDLPERAEDFADGISTKVASFRESIEKMKRATPNMITALENMRDGCDRWLNN